jgi:hypothetical protein
MHDRRRQQIVTPRVPPREILRLALLVLALVACGGRAAAAVPTATPGAAREATAPLAGPTPATAAATPAVAPSVAPAGQTPVATARPGGPTTPNQADDAPAWWPRELAPPRDAVSLGALGREALWSTPDGDQAGLRDRLAQQGRDGGYQVVVSDALGVGYTLLFTKGERAYALDITEASDGTALTGRLAGVLHLTTSGAASVDLALPMKTAPTSYASGDFGLELRVPDARCADCVYAVHLFLPAAAYHGPGSYQLSGGDVWVTPGGVSGGFSEDYYREPEACTVVVADAFSGSFECSGLTNPNQASKTISAQVSWRFPAEDK